MSEMIVQVYVRSTDWDRTLMSAYSNLAGLYLPEGFQVWNVSIEKLLWQPIPVHTVPKESDHVSLYMCYFRIGLVLISILLVNFPEIN